MTPSHQSRESEAPIRRSVGDGASYAGALSRYWARVRPLRRATPRARTTQRPCGHTHHVGSCPTCQEVQLARWREQLADADDRTPVSGEEERS
jgi:hypothetical protein